MFRYEEELKAVGFKGDLADFQDGLADIFANVAAGRSVDNLLCCPDDAKRFCHLARLKFRVPDLTDEIILNFLLNMRKRP